MLNGVDDSVASCSCIMSALQAEHLQGVVEVGSVLTLPRFSGDVPAVILHSLDDMVGRAGGGAVPLIDLSNPVQGEESEVEMDDGGGLDLPVGRVAADIAKSPEEMGTICLRVVDTTPDSAHVVKACPAFAKGLPRNSFVVAVHDSCCLGGSQLMRGSARMFGQAGCCLVLLSAQNTYS